MKRLLLVLTLLLTQSTQAQTIFNGDFENGNPGWKMGYDSISDKLFRYALDSTVSHSGRYALRLETDTRDYALSRLTFTIPDAYKAQEITLRGYIKTENVNTDAAGLFIALTDAKGKIYAAEEMDNAALKGTTPWQYITIRVPYDPNRVSNIKIGGWLNGSGKIWIDDLDLLLDGQPLANARLTTRQPIKAISDTLLRHASGIRNIQLNAQQLVNLTYAGQFWAFLKYHHPAIAKGNYNWDAELFRLLPPVLSAKNNKALSTALEKYLDQLPVPDSCRTCKAIAAQNYIILPDYGSLLDGKVLSAALTQKLQYIRDNRNTLPNYYVTTTSMSNPDFSNENPYAEMTYPDAGYRLLCLFRYWGIINYFFPNRDIIGKNWTNVLTTSLPEFVQAKNEMDYSLAALKLIGNIHDTHANIWDGNKAIDDYRGKYAAPFKAIFAEGKLVIVDLHTDTADVKKKLAVGDIIEKIEDVAVDTLVQKYLPYTPASNYDTQLRNLPKLNLLRSNHPQLKLTINRHGQRFEYTTPMGATDLIKRDTKREQAQAYTVLDNNIGLVFPMKYKNEMLPAIRKTFSGVKGIIIDMRCYPGNFMPYTFGNYIKTGNSPFARFSYGTIDYPGAFKYFAAPHENGGTDSTFKGPVVVIVNSSTQSQAEFTTMAFQSAANVKVVGSTTAGADGDVSFFYLPGGIQTLISGLGVYYPDNGPTQRVGVRIDYPLYPTIKGLSAGRDELMEKAVEMIEKREW